MTGFCCVFKFLRRSVNEKHLMCSRSEISVFKFLWCVVDRPCTILKMQTKALIYIKFCPILIAVLLEYKLYPHHWAWVQVNTRTICCCVGHSGPVRSVYVQDSEHCFLSASKDKTVKLWSLSNHGDGTAQSASSWTYYRHTRPVFHVGMVESVRQSVSCDGSLHVCYHYVSSWRSYLCKSIHRLR